MTPVTQAGVRAYIVQHVSESLGSDWLADDLRVDDLDLMSEGLIDSFGLAELIAALAEHFHVEDFSDLDSDAITRIGPLSSFVASRVVSNNAS